MSQRQEIIVTEEMKGKYAKIVKDNGIEKEIKEISIFRPELKGDHLGSTCDEVTIKFQDGSDDLELFEKQKVTDGSPMVTAMFEEMMLFQKESAFFNSFLPHAKQFCRRQIGDDNVISCFAKCYYADNSCVVLENVAKRDYVMRDKSVLQNFDEASVTLKNMAKFHGVSFAMASEMGREQFITNYPLTTKESNIRSDLPSYGPMYTNNIINCCKVLQASPGEETQVTVDWLMGQIEDLYPRLCKTVENAAEDLLQVVNHGDCWNNNMMFRRDKTTNEILDHIFVDLQVTRFGSPNLDVSFYLFTSVLSEVRQQNLEGLLKIYFDTFLETVSKLKVSLAITFEDFMKDYKKKCLLGFIFGLNMKTAIGAIKDVDNDKMGNDWEEMKKYFNQVVEKWIADNFETVKNIAKDVIGSVKEFRKLTQS